MLVTLIGRMRLSFCDLVVRACSCLQNLIRKFNRRFWRCSVTYWNAESITAYLIPIMFSSNLFCGCSSSSKAEPLGKKMPRICILIFGIEQNSSYLLVMNKRVAMGVSLFNCKSNKSKKYEWKRCRCRESFVSLKDGGNKATSNSSRALMAPTAFISFQRQLSALCIYRLLWRQ